MKKLTIKLLGWLLSANLIESLYQQYLPAKFQIVQQKQINVKKGKRRYTLLIIETDNPAQKVIFNLSRH